MVPSGELLIERVNGNDSSSSFQCRTVNRLTGETTLSANAHTLLLLNQERHQGRYHCN